VIPLPNVDNGVEVGGNAHDIVIGGLQPTFNVIPQNTIGSNGGNGVAVVGTAHKISINNGYIGLDVFGTGPRGNALAGIYLGGGTYSNTIGSTDAALPTLIDSNVADGIAIVGSNYNTVMGTSIGADRFGNARGNGGNGISITGGSNNVIGRNVVAGVALGGKGNVIANNVLNGVFVASGNGNGIHQNSIYGNTLKGIELAPGANRDQAAPILTSVITTPGAIRVSGVLNSRPNTAYTIEFYASTSNSSSGKYYLGSLAVRTNRLGVASYTYTGARPPAGATYVTATATDPQNDTSEFSNVAT
jgi:hypothetical protein